MTPHHPIASYISLHPSLAAAIYFASIAIFMVTALLVSIGLAQTYTSRNASLERLAQVQARGSRLAMQQPSTEEVWPAGSSLMEGATVTIAGASLLQRVSVAITNAAGSLESSELEAPESDTKDNLIRATANFEIEQLALQSFLYDIEAGMPFLFVEQLLVTPVSHDSRKLRVVARVSGRWSGAN